MILKLHIVLLVLFIIQHAMGQQTEPLFPMSFETAISDTLDIKKHLLKSISQKSLLKEDKIFTSPYRYGVCSNINIDFKKSATIVYSDSIGTLWQYKILSPGAFGIEMVFDTFKLPKGAKLFVLDKTNTTYLGAFTWRNNNVYNMLPISIMEGDEITIEYYEPYDCEFIGSLFLGQACYAYKPIQYLTKQKASSSTSPGINCEEGSNWQAEKHSVCKYTFTNGSYSYSCTGALINNTKNDGTPYFLTANHCISTSEVARIARFYFNYEQLRCNTGSISQNKTISGAELLATGSESDFTLLKMLTKPDSSYQPFYAGWNINTTSTKSGACIHHPEGDPKRIALSSKAASSYPYQVQWDGNTTTPTNSHWYVGFTTGDTYPGSSGAPYFDANKRIIGQLHGGPDGTANTALFGKISYSWTLGTTSNKQLKSWLNPNNLNVKVLDGYSPPIMPEPNFYTPFTNVCINTPVWIKDTSEFEPTSWKWAISPSTYIFNNNTNDSSQHINLSFLNSDSYTFTLTVKNKYGTKSKTKTSFINSGNTIHPEIIGLDSSYLCGNQLDSIHIHTTGSEIVNYKLIQNKERLIYSTIGNTLFLGLNKELTDSSWFYAKIIIEANHGLCSSTIEKDLKIYVPINDNISNAFELQIGYNGLFSNTCATVQANEPKPKIVDCNLYNGWCSEGTEAKPTLNNSVWFYFTCPENGTISLVTTGFDNQMAVYEAASETDLLNGKYRMAGANDNNQTTSKNAVLNDLKLSQGKKYFVQIDGGNNGHTGNFSIAFRAIGFDISNNPSKEIFKIRINAPQKNGFTIEVYTMTGNKVYSKSYNSSEEAQSIALNLPQLQQGVYNVIINLNGTIYSKKIIKL